MFRETVQEILIQLNELHVVFQFLGIIVLSMIPFLESPGAALAGGLIGLSPFISATASIVGNALSIMLIIIPFNFLISKFKNRKSKKEGFISKRASKARRRYEKYGVAGVALIAPVLFSGHIGAFVSLTAGANRKKVIFWHMVSIVIWAIVGAVLGLFLYHEIM